MPNTKKFLRFMSLSVAIVFFAGLALVCVPTWSKAADVPIPGTIVKPGIPWVNTTKFKKKPPWTIGMSMPALTDNWLVYSLDLMKVYAKEHPKLIKHFYITNAEGSPVKQIADCQDLIAKHVDVLLSTPVSPAANPGQEAAYRKGIPVIQFTRTGGTEEFTAELVTPEVEIGRMLATWLCKTLHGKGNIVVFAGAAGSWPAEGRLMGMRQVLAKYPGIKIVAGPAYTNWNMATAKKTMEDWIASNMKIDGILSDSGLEALPAMQAWLEAGRKPIPCTGDIMNGWLKLVKKDHLVAYSTTNVPLFIGVQAMATAFRILRGEPVPREATFPVYQITNKNINKWVRPDLNDYYFPWDSIPGFFQAPEALRQKLFGPHH